MIPLPPFMSESLNGCGSAAVKPLSAARGEATVMYIAKELLISFLIHKLVLLKTDSYKN